jgi:flagellar biosynthesis anti-sigma factor FlgM
MRVDFTNLGLQQPEKSKSGRAAPARATSPPVTNETASNSNSTGLDEARFSFDQTRVQSLATQALGAPDVRPEKVGPLQDSVASGQYKVDATQVAEAMAADLRSARVR